MTALVGSQQTEERERRGKNSRSQEQKKERGKQAAGRKELVSQEGERSRAAVC